MINILKKLLKKIMPDFLFRIIYKTASWTYDLINSQFKQKRLKMFEKIENQKDEKRKYLLYPELVSIFLTTKCNLKCFICRPDGFSGENLKLENLYKLKNAIHYAKIIELTGWGEAFIYKDLEKVLKYIYSVNNKDIIRITTNGTKLSKKWAELLSGHLYSLNISLNAATKETYESQMIGGNFEKTIANIESFTSALDKSDKEKVRLHFVAHRKSFEEIPEFIELSKKLNITNVSVGNYYVHREDHLSYSLLNDKDEFNRVIYKSRELAKKLEINFLARTFYSDNLTKKKIA